MFNRQLVPALLAGLCATTSAIVACSHDRHNTTMPPVGESTAAGPADPTVPPPDSAGVPPDDQPVQPVPHTMIQRSTAHRVAQADGYASDAGIPIAGDAGTKRPIGGGQGSGSGSGIGSGMPGQPGLPQPTPGQPTPGQPSPPPTPAPHR